jgi:RNA polymerase-binding transcription factor DksA
MSIAEIKETKSKLIAWIEQLSDSNMLAVLDTLRNSKQDKDWWDDLSDAQKQHINEGIDDEENGRVISSEEFWKNLKNG